MSKKNVKHLVENAPLTSVQKYQRFKHLLTTFLPVIGVMVFGWDIAFIFAQIWIRNVVEGLFTYIKVPFLKTLKTRIFYRILGLIVALFWFVIMMGLYGAFTVIWTAYMFGLTHPETRGWLNFWNDAYSPIVYYAAIVTILEVVDLIWNFWINKGYKKTGYFKLMNKSTGRQMSQHIALLLFPFGIIVLILIFSPIFDFLNSRYGYNFSTETSLSVPVQIVAGILIGSTELFIEKVMKTWPRKD